MSNFSQYKLDAVIANAAQKAFGNAIAQNPADNFFAFALTTHGFVQYVTCSLNSDQNLESALARSGVADNRQKSYYKWYPNEWGEFEHFAHDDEAFAAVQGLLRRIESDTNNCGEERRRYVFEMMNAALSALDEEGCFGVGEVRR